MKHSSRSGIASHMPNQKPDGLAPDALKKISRKFIVMSGKGGVGKTSVSVNLAIALANMGYKVGLLDVDIHGPDVPQMLGLSGILSVDLDKKMVPMRYGDNLKVVSMEFLTQNKDDAIIWRGPVKHTVIRQFIGEVGWGVLDFLVIDSPPGTGDEPLTVAKLIPDAQAIIVTTPQEVALADIRKSISFCRNVNMGIFGIIENMSGFICPHCGKNVDIFGTGGGEKTAKTYGLRFLGRIPFDPDMVTCGDQGVSFQHLHAQSPITDAFIRIAEIMIPKN
ncbi:MAG: Mrp/NBP35 family ATP-binding protein [Desulfobacter postgatei]|uniref:Mrp/NBP35 family ATP-binding protein n=1 Tax=Desulfobacter postgatei TaxID=2293 RepID=UPI0023F283D8|nr:Mrp/NBP35 family ATP-binding protein [Desulfobacter postgatei]MDD4272354.1 Mrp/NBP35 family ATP-binding protein [Desulfobacter postgatei]